MRQPLIGISGSIDAQEKQHFLLRSYMQSVLTAGGMPVLLSPDMDEKTIDGLLQRLDGVYLAGGNDVAPECFGEEPLPELGEVNPLRDQFEIRLVRRACRVGMPVLGICRGVQSMNVAMGGTLWQDIPSQYRRPDGERPIAHQQKRPDHCTSHRVHVTEGTLLHRIVGVEELAVNSFHHQAIREVAPGCTAAAHASDGVVEALEQDGGAFFLGVQWHPERYFHKDPAAKAIFEAFVQACRQYAARDR